MLVTPLGEDDEETDVGRGLGKGMHEGEWDEDVCEGENKRDFSCCRKDTSSASWIVSGNLFHRVGIAFWNDLEPECVRAKHSF